MQNNLADNSAPPAPASPGRCPWFRVAFLGLFLAFLALVVLFGLWSAFSSAEDAVVLEEPSMGLESAPITIVEYGDFSCLQCRDWQRSATRELLLLEYGPDVVRFVWRNFSVSSEQSAQAAEAARCAHEQDKFWDYHNLLFLMTPNLSTAELKAYAKRAGLNTRRFNQCLDSGKYSAIVEQEINQAHALGINQAPTFMINDQPLIGPIPFGLFKSIIDNLLAQQEGA